MATQTEVTIDGVSMGKPLNNRVDGFWELSYYVKDENGEYIYSSEFGPPDEINERVALLQKHPKIYSRLWITEPTDTDSEVIILPFENSLKDYNGDSVGEK
jgi:hypothetical protein